LVATVEEYDPGTNMWTNCGTPAPANACTPMPTARDSLGMAALSGKLYAVGGNDGSVSNAVEAYDPTTNTWAPKAPMTTARRYLGVAASFNGKLYAVGGSLGGSTGLATVE